MGKVVGGAATVNLANDWISTARSVRCHGNRVTGRQFLDARRWRHWSHPSPLVSPLTAYSNMSDHELTEEDHEINVLDTDSRLSHSESEPSRSRCSSPEGGGPTTNATLPFSISNLLGKNFEHKSESDELPYHPYQQQGLLQQRGFVPPGFYGQGVLRVPAHRPLGGPSSPGAVFGPWTLGLDPVLQRSAAAAAFASQVVKDRLAGECLFFNQFKVLL